MDGLTEHQRTLRAVWAAYTARPGASYREIGRLVGLAPSTVMHAKEELARYGYLRYAERTARSVRVVIPFHVGGMR